MRITGDSTTGAGIFPDDIGIVDRSKTPRDKSTIVAILDGEFTVVNAVIAAGSKPRTRYGNIELTEEMSFEAWGCLKNSIRMF